MLGDGGRRLCGTAVGEAALDVNVVASAVRTVFDKDPRRRKTVTELDKDALIEGV